MMQKRLLFAILVLFAAACGNNSNDQKPATGNEPQPEPVVAKTADGRPVKVSGVFKGVMPCADCQELEAILEIKDNDYTYNFIRKGVTNKMALLGQRQGTCVFDSGMLKLMDNGKVNEQFLLLSADSIRLSGEVKSKRSYVLVRKR